MYEFNPSTRCDVRARSRQLILFSLGLMRAARAIVAVLVALLVGCGARADDPKVDAPVSPEDVREICALVRAQTTEPIESISEVVTEAFVPGVTPRLWFDIQKKDGKWTIVKTERVTYR